MVFGIVGGAGFNVVIGDVLGVVFPIVGGAGVDVVLDDVLGVVVSVVDVTGIVGIFVCVGVVAFSVVYDHVDVS